MKNLLYRGIFWRGVYYLTVFLVTIAIARMFKAGDSGVINYLLNNLALLVLVSSFSLESATGYYSATAEIDQPSLAGASIAMAVGSMIIISAVLKFAMPAMEDAIWCACIVYCGGVILMNYFSALFYSHYDYFLPNAIVGIGNSAIVAITVFFPAPLVAEGGRLFIIVYFSSFMLAGLILATVYTGRYSKNIRLPSSASMRLLFRYAGVALIINLISFLVVRVDYWFVHHNCTETELGNYIQVSKLAQIFILLPTIIGGLVFTRTAKGGPGTRFRELQLLSRLVLSALALILLLIALTGYWLFPFIYGGTFTLMYRPFLLLIPGILSLVTLALITASNAGRGQLRFNLRGALIGLVVIVVGNVIFSERYGVYAAAIVSSIGYISYLVYIIVTLKNTNQGMSIKDFFIPQRGDIAVIKSVFKEPKPNVA